MGVAVTGRGILGGDLVDFAACVRGFGCSGSRCRLQIALFLHLEVDLGGGVTHLVQFILLLRAFFAALFGGFGMLLRNKAIFGLEPLFFTLLQLFGGALIGAIMGGVVADEAFELGVNDGGVPAVGVLLGRCGQDDETTVLAAEGALGEPGRSEDTSEL